MTAGIFSAVAGACTASLLACVPGLHVYNVMGVIAIWIHSSGGPATGVPPEILVPFATGMIVGYSMLNTVPSVLLAAPDESAFLTVLPGQKYLMNGRGYEGTIIAAGGGLAGLFVLILVAGPLAPRLLPVARTVLTPHFHWILYQLGRLAEKCAIAHNAVVPPRVPVKSAFDTLLVPKKLAQLHASHGLLQLHRGAFHLFAFRHS